MEGEVIGYRVAGGFRRRMIMDLVEKTGSSGGTVKTQGLFMTSNRLASEEGMGNHGTGWTFPHFFYPASGEATTRSLLCVGVVGGD